MTKKGPKKERKSSITVQFTDTQFEWLDEIMSIVSKDAYAPIVRDALDFYVAKKYPQLLKK